MLEELARETSAAESWSPSTRRTLSIGIAVSSRVSACARAHADSSGSTIASSIGRFMERGGTCTSLCCNILQQATRRRAETVTCARQLRPPCCQLWRTQLNHSRAPSFGYDIGGMPLTPRGLSRLAFLMSAGLKPAAPASPLPPPSGPNASAATESLMPQWARASGSTHRCLEAQAALASHRGGRASFD